MDLDVTELDEASGMRYSPSLHNPLQRTGANIIGSIVIVETVPCSMVIYATFVTTRSLGRFGTTKWSGMSISMHN